MLKLNKNCNKQGFTFVEMVISLTCMLIIFAGVFSIFSGQNRINTAEQQIMDIQMNSRVALQHLGKTFKHAGFGTYESLTKSKVLSGTDPDNGSVNVDSVFWDINDQPANGTASDSVVVPYGLRQVANVNGTVNSTATVPYMNLTSNPPIPTNSGFTSYIYFFPNSGGNVFYKISSISTSNSTAGEYTLNEEVQLLLNNSDIFMVAPVRIKVENNSLILQNFASGNSLEIANNIQSLQLQYTTDGNNWVDDPGSLNDITGVKVYLLSRTDRVEPGYTNTHTYSMADQIVGPFNDGYHRKLSISEYSVRNTD